MVIIDSAAKFKPQPVKELLIPTDKLLCFLSNSGELDNAEMFEKKKKTGKGKKSTTLEVKSTVNLTVPNSGKIEPLDRLVLMAACAFQSAGNQYITLRQLCKYLGDRGKDTNSKFAKAVMASISKLRCTDFKINMGLYLKNCTDTPDQSLECKKNTNLLPATVHETNYHCGSNEEKVVVIELIGKIPILEVANVKNQVARLPLKLIQGLNLRLNERAIVLAWYLLERAAKIKGSIEHKRTRNLQPVIKFETLYSDCGFTGLDKNQRHDLFERIKQVLDHFKATGFIAGYELTKTNNEYSAIKLTLTE